MPNVDTSGSFAGASIPTREESFLVIRFAAPEEVDFEALHAQIMDSFRSHADTLVAPGAAGDNAMRLIVARRIRELIEEGRRLRAAPV